jgi:hypothetical protein
MAFDLSIRTTNTSHFFNPPRFQRLIFFLMDLVHGFPNPLGFAPGQLAVFQKRERRPGSGSYDHTGRASHAEKQPTGRSPEGCVENGSAASLLVSRRSIIDPDTLLPCASQTTLFERNETQGI